jgi:hydrogenase-1 operon protein HyaF
MSDGASFFQTPNMARALAREIAEHLRALVERGDGAVIDLRSLPMAPEDRAELDALLGEGEVRATVEAAGRSDVIETRFPGVWLVRHHDAHGALQMEQIQIAPVADILRADPADMAAAAAALDHALAEGDSDAAP